MLCSLFHGSSTQSCGTLAPSASDAIILACLAYRNRAFKRGIRKPEIIVGENADIAFTKAGKFAWFTNSSGTKLIKNIKSMLELLNGLLDQKPV